MTTIEIGANSGDLDPLREAIEKSRLSPYVLYLLAAFFPDRIPEGNYYHTNLAGLGGKDPLTLSPRNAEKAITTLVGLERPPAFIRAEKGVIYDDNGAKIIKLYDPHKKTFFDGQNFIEKIIATGKDLIGLRIQPNGSENGSRVPFIRFGSLEDPGLKKDDKGRIYGFLINEGGEKVEYKFQEGDLVDIFLDPKSISRPMRNPNTGQLENLILGGGFTLQLSDFDPQKKEWHFTIDITFNDVNIRNFGEEKYKPYCHSFVLNVRDGNGRYDFRPNSVSLITSIEDTSIKEFANLVVQSFIKKNNQAMYRLFQYLLETNPDFKDGNAIKCHYATVNTDKPKLVTYAFDVETAPDEEYRWKNKVGDNKNPTFIYYRPGTHRLNLVIDAIDGIFEPSPLDTIRQLVSRMTGTVSSDLRNTKEFFDSIQATQEHYRFTEEQVAYISRLLTSILPQHHDLILSSIKLHLQDNSKGISIINKDLPNKYQAASKFITSTLTLERAIGALLPHLVTQEKLNKSLIQSVSSVDVEIYDIEVNDEVKILYLSGLDIPLAYIYSTDSILCSTESAKPATLKEIKSTILNLQKEADIELNFVPAMLHYLREGD